MRRTLPSRCSTSTANCTAGRPRSPTTARNRRSSSASIGSAISGRSSTRVRWAEIWRKTQIDGSATVVHVLARNKQCEHSEIDRARDRSLPRRRHAACENRDTPGGGAASAIAAAGYARGDGQRRAAERHHGYACAGGSKPWRRRSFARCWPSTASLQLRHIASPSLPQHYSAAIDGLLIGPKTGSCGTAAFRGEPVEVTDIATDPLWEDYQAPRPAARAARMLVHAPSRQPMGASSAPSHSIIRARAARTSLERQVVATCRQPLHHRPGA